MVKALALTLWGILQRLVAYSRGALRNLLVTKKKEEQFPPVAILKKD